MVIVSNPNRQNAKRILLDSIVGSNGTLVDDGQVLLGEVLRDTLDNNLGLGGLEVLFLGGAEGSLDQRRHSQEGGSKDGKLHGGVLRQED